MNSRAAAIGLAGLALVSALLVSSCSSVKAGEIRPESPSHAAQRLLPDVLAHPDGVLREASGTVTAGDPVQFFLVPTKSPISFSSLEPRDHYEVPLIDSAGQPVGTFGLGNAGADGQLELTSVDDGDSALLVAKAIGQLRSEGESSAQFKVVGGMSGYWIAVKDSNGEFGVPVFNANGATRVIGKRYPISEFASR